MEERHLRNLQLVNDATTQVKGFWRIRKGKKEYVQEYGRESMKHKSYGPSPDLPPLRIKMKDKSSYRYHASYDTPEKAWDVVKRVYSGDARVEQIKGKYAVYHNEKIKPESIKYLYGKGLGTYSRTNTGGMKIALTNQVQVLIQKFSGKYVATVARNVGPMENIEGATSLPDAVKKYMRKYNIHGEEMFSRKEGERAAAHERAAQEIRKYAEKFNREHPNWGRRDMRNLDLVNAVIVNDDRFSAYRAEQKRLDANRGQETNVPYKCPKCGTMNKGVGAVLGERSLAPAYARVFCKCKNCGTRFYFQV